MSVKVPEHVVQQVIRSTNLVSLIGRYTGLKKSGKRFQGLCPFHKEKTPSFSVDPERGLYYCFGCHAGGNVFTFLKQMEGLEFPEALERLAGDAGVDLTQYRREAGPSRGEFERLRDVMELASAYYAKCLEKGGQAAQRYLKQRRISDESAARWRLGFAPDGWDHFLRAALRRGYDPSVLESAGLAVSRTGGQGHYDRFRNRLMFPVGDRSGRTIAFGARALGEEDEPKYLNSPEGPLFSKGRCFYGLSEAMEAIRESKTAMIVEGYTDVIMAHQFGFGGVLAVLGTSLTEDHARALSGMCECVVLVFDADEAGLNSAARSCEVLLREDLEVRVASLPAGQDPCEFLLGQGAGEFRKRLEESEDFFDFRVRRARGDHDTATVAGRNRGFQDLAELALTVPNEARRDMLIRKVAAEFGVSERSAFAYVERSWLQGRRGVRKVPAEQEVPAVAPCAEASVPFELLGLLLVNPDLQPRACKELDTNELHEGHDRALLERLLDRCRKEGMLEAGEFIHSLDEPQLIAAASRAVAEEDKRQHAILEQAAVDRYQVYIEYLNEQRMKSTKQALLQGLTTTAAPTTTTTTVPDGYVGENSLEGGAPPVDEDEALRQYMERRRAEDEKSRQDQSTKGR